MLTFHNCCRTGWPYMSPSDQVLLARNEVTNYAAMVCAARAEPGQLTRFCSRDLRVHARRHRIRKRKGQCRETTAPGRDAACANCRASATVNAASTERGPSTWTTPDRDRMRVPHHVNQCA